MLSLVCSISFFVHVPPVCGQCIVNWLQRPVQLHVVLVAVGHQISIFSHSRSPVASQPRVNALPDIIFCANTTLFWYASCPLPDTETEQSPVPQFKFVFRHLRSPPPPQVISQLPSHCFDLHVSWPEQFSDCTLPESKLGGGTQGLVVWLMMRN